MVDFLFTLIEFFAIYCGSGTKGEMCTARLFSQGVDLFALHFYPDRVISRQPFLATEN